MWLSGLQNDVFLNEHDQQEYPNITALGRKFKNFEGRDWLSGEIRDLLQEIAGLIKAAEKAPTDMLDELLWAAQGDFGPERGLPEVKVQYIPYAALWIVSVSWSDGKRFGRQESNLTDALVEVYKQVYCFYDSIHGEGAFSKRKRQ